VVVHYTGLHCFGETDWDQSSNSDEPYVILSISTPERSATLLSRIYEDVDGGEARLDLIELYPTFRTPNWHIRKLRGKSESSETRASKNTQLFWWRSVKDQVYDIPVTARIRENALIASALRQPIITKNSFNS
jgi:hypothetical protein